jgi:hypothetical protein
MSAAEAVDLTAGVQHAAVNIRMVRRQGVRVTGQVVLPETGVSRYAGVSVALDSDDSTVHPSIHGQLVQGAFTIRDVPPGSYTLQARVGQVQTPDGMQPSLAASQRIEVATSDVGGFVLKLEPQTPRDVPATVTFESDARPGELYLYLQPANASTITEELKTGSPLVFRNLIPGRYQSLWLHQPRIDATMFYLKSARLGEEDILGRAFDIPSDSDASLQLTVGVASMALVQGVVTDATGQPAGETTVMFVPTKTGPPFASRSVEADQTGAFFFSAPEGEYRVSAWKTSLHSDSIDDAEFLQRQASETVILKRGPNPKLNLSLTR